MPTPIWKFLHLRRRERGSTCFLALPGCAPPYTLTYTGDELNSDFQTKEIDWKGGDDVTAGEESGLNLLSESSVNDSRCYSDDISSIQSKTQDFEHLGEQPEKIILETRYIPDGDKSSAVNVVLSKSLSERIGRIIARYSYNNYTSWEVVRHSQSSSANRSTSSSKSLLRQQLETSNASSCDQTSPKKSFSITTALRRRSEFQNNRNHQLMNNDDMQDHFTRDTWDRMNAETQLSNYNRQEDVGPRSLSSKKMRIGKKRTVASLNTGESVLEMQGQFASSSASTSKHRMTNTPNGFCVDEFQELPSWRAERILYNRREALEMESDLFRGVGEVVEDDGNLDLSTYKRRVFKFAIQEQDWWKTVAEDNNDTTAREKAATGSGNSSETCESSQLCAAGPMNYFDSLAFSTRLSVWPRRCKKKERGDKTNTKKVFYNVGLSVWNQSRAEWRSYKCNTETTICPSSSGDSSTTMASFTTQCCSGGKLSVSQNVESHSSPESTSRRVNNCQRSLTHTQYKELVQGLTNVTRDYQLPKAMNLADLIEVYVDLWDWSDER